MLVPILSLVMKIYDIHQPFARINFGETSSMVCRRFPDRSHTHQLSTCHSISEHTRSCALDADMPADEKQYQWVKNQLEGDRNVAGKKLSKFNPKTFLSTMDGGRKIAAFPIKQTIFVQGDSSDAVFYIQK